MKSLPRLFFPSALLCVAMAACQTVSFVPPVTPALVSAGEKAGATAADLEAGRRLYGGKCTACHSAEPIGRYSVGEWPGIIADMAGRAKLNAAEREQLRDYIFAAHQTLPR
jgi:cytochrome c5